MSAAHQQGFAPAMPWGAVPRRAPSARGWDMPNMVAETPGVGRDAQYLEAVARFLVLETDEEPQVADDDGEAPTWLDDVYSFVAQGRVDPAIDLVFRHVDDLLASGRFGRCDDLLRTIDLKRLDTNLLVGVLSITLCAADKLAARPHFVDRVADRLEALAPGRVERLLAGLR